MVLYHVSKISGLKVLKPFSHNAMDGEKAVFATNDIMFALSMAYGTGNDIAVGYHCNTKTKEKEFYIDELEKFSNNLSIIINQRKEQKEKLKEKNREKIQTFNRI